MPELPDITVYVERLGARTIGNRLQRIRIISPFLLRTAQPPLEESFDRKVSSISRIGKRIVIGLEGDYYLVIHLMVTGRLRWRDGGAKPPRKGGLAAFEFSTGTLLFTEAGIKHRASLHLVQGDRSLDQFHKGGIEVLESDDSAFIRAMRAENHTVKRALTDPRIISGVGNTFSDEILHATRMSPYRQTKSMSDEELVALFEKCRLVLDEWTKKLREEVGEGFPEKVSAFKEGMAVHGRFQKPCPVCNSPVQRIRYTNNESNYCPNCQTGGKLLADRALSRLLKDDWPKTIEELERLQSGVT